MEGKKESLFQVGYRLYKENLGPCLGAGFVFFVMALASIAGGLLGVDLLAVLIALILLPMLFAYQYQVVGLAHGIQLKASLPFRLWLAYFTRDFRGVYRFLLSFLKGIGVFAGALVLSSSLGGAIAYAIDPGYKEGVDAVNQALIDGGSLENIYILLSGNRSWLYFQAIVTLISVFFGMWMFLHAVGLQSYSLFFRNLYPKIPGRYANHVYNRGIALHRKAFLKRHYSIAWPLLLLYVFGFVGGGAISLLFSTSILIVIPSALAGATLLMTFALPPFFYAQEKVYALHRPDILSFAFKEAERSYEYAKQSGQLSPEDIEEMERQMQKAKEEMEKPYDPESGDEE